MSKAGKYILLLLLLFTVTPYNLVYSHGFGASFEETSGKYFIDIGYDPEIVVAGESVIFDFDLLSSSTNEEEPFTDIWVKITRDNETIMATGVHKARLGKTSLIFTYPGAGEYILSTRYQNEGENLVEAEFPLTVEPSANTDGKLQLLPLFTGMLGLIIGMLFTLLKSKKTHEK